MDIAFKKFFKGAGFPKFKSKHKGKQSFSIPQNVIVENDLLIIPKFKEGINIVLHREIKGTIKSATISVTPTGKYFVSVLVDTNTEMPIKAPIKENTTLTWVLKILQLHLMVKYLKIQRTYEKHKVN